MLYSRNGLIPTCRGIFFNTLPISSYSEHFIYIPIPKHLPHNKAQPAERNGVVPSYSTKAHPFIPLQQAPQPNPLCFNRSLRFSLLLHLQRRRGDLPRRQRINDGTIHHEHRASDHSPIRCSFKMPSYKIHAFNSEARAAIIKEFEDCLIKLPHFFTCHICLRGSPDFLPDKVVDPFPPMSLSQMLTLTDQITDLAASRGLRDGLLLRDGLFRRVWDVKEDKDALYLRVAMPAGVGKEDVKVSVEQNILVITGKESERWRRYSSRIDMHPNLYKIDQIKAEMKNGVLKVVLPKVEEERKDVLSVKID